MQRTVPAVIVLLLFGVSGFGQDSRGKDLRLFHVKFVTADAVYVDGGSAAGLSEGSRLSIKRPQAGETALTAASVAEIVVTSVATISAVCEIRSSEVPIQPGDIAHLSSEDAERIAQADAAKQAQNYSQVVSFNGEDPLEEELRDEVPKPPLAEINRFRGRIALEHSAIYDRSGSGGRSYEEGLVLRTDMTRIGGTYWSLNGYWRGAITKQPTALPQQTLTDMLNRVYHIGLRYDSPKSPYVAGFGRLLLPWASSISTIDGGYFGRHLGATTIGAFAGSTPDPTAWNYAPGREILGSFVSHETGTTDGTHYLSTAGVAVTRIHWKPERQFAFLENSFLFKHHISVYNNIEADYLGKSSGSDQRFKLSRSFATLRLQPVRRISFDLSHNYFRVLPTFNSTLIASGLVDNLLFQGLNGGTNLEVAFHIVLHAAAGRSKTTADPKQSWNFLYGATLPQTSWLHVRLDARHSRFASAAGSGDYNALSVLRESSDRWRIEIQGGNQRFQSITTGNAQSRFAILNADLFVGRHAVIGIGGSIFRGGLQSYDQVLARLGYRF
jgi:hypothetical protein